MMNTLLQRITRLFGRLPDDDPRVTEADVTKAVELIIKGTDPRLRLVPDYKGKLRRPVIRTLVHLNDLAQRVPGPFRVDRRTYATDPQVNALFGSADQLDAVFEPRRPPLRACLERPGGAGPVYTNLRTIRNERRVFGMALTGGMVRKGVAQTSLYFSKHEITVCNRTVDAVREEMKWRGFHTLVTVALQRIVDRKTESEELETQRILLRAKLRDVQAQHQGLEGCAELDAAGKTEECRQTSAAVKEPADNRSASKARAIQQRLEETEQALNQAKASFGTLGDYLKQVAKVFSHPSSYLRVKPKSFRVNRLGIQVGEGEERASGDVVTLEVRVKGFPAMDLILTEFRPPEESGDAP